MQQKAAQNNGDRIGIVEYRRRAGGKIAVGREQQHGRKAYADHAGKGDLPQRAAADVQPAAAVRQQRQQRKGETVAQQHQACGRNAFGVKNRSAQRHTAVDHGAENNEQAALELVAALHGCGLLPVNDATIIPAASAAVKPKRQNIRRVDKICRDWYAVV